MHTVAVGLLVNSGKRRVNRVEILRRMCAACCRRVGGVSRGGCWSVALWYRTLAVRGGVGGGWGRWGSRVWCGRVGSGLYLRRAWLLLEDGVVAKTLAFALLAVAAHGVGFVALVKSQCVNR